MKKRIASTGLLVIAALLGIVLAGPAPEALAQKVIAIKVADGLPAGHIQVVEGLAPFMKEVEARSKGRVKFTHYTSGQLGKQNDMLELLKSGVADMAYIGPSYFAGKMPLSGVFELPQAYPSSAVGSEAYWQMSVNGILAKEEWGKHNVLARPGPGLRPLRDLQQQETRPSARRLQGHEAPHGRRHPGFDGEGLRCRLHLQDPPGAL